MPQYVRTAAHDNFLGIVVDSKYFWKAKPGIS